MSHFGVCLICGQILNISQSYVQGTTDPLLICDCDKSMYDLTVNQTMGFLWEVEGEEQAKKLSTLCTVLKHFHLVHYRQSEDNVRELQNNKKEETTTKMKVFV